MAMGVYPYMAMRPGLYPHGGAPYPMPPSIASDPGMNTDLETRSNVDMTPHDPAGWPWIYTDLETRSNVRYASPKPL